MRDVLHIYDTTAEANAFVDGVLWVNDSAIEVVDILVGDDDNGPRSAVLCRDGDGDVDAEFDHRMDRESVRKVQVRLGDVPCVCTVIDQRDGAICMCHDPGEGPSEVCPACQRGEHEFRVGVRSMV